MKNLTLTETTIIILLLIITGCSNVMAPVSSKEGGLNGETDTVYTVTGWKSFYCGIEFDYYGCEIWDRHYLDSRDSCQVFYNDGYLFSGDLAPFGGKLWAVFAPPDMSTWENQYQAITGDTIAINLQYHDIEITWLIEVVRAYPDELKFKTLLYMAM